MRIGIFCLVALGGLVGTILVVAGEPQGKDALTLVVPGAQVTLIRGARVRLEAQDTWSRISVIEGTVRFSSPAAENAPSPASAAPSSLVAHNPSVASSRPVAPGLPGDAKVRPTDKTKVLRIYGGAGYFDLAMAEELRPTLARALVLAQTDLMKTAPSQATVPSKAESQRKVPVAANL